MYLPVLVFVFSCIHWSNIDTFSQEDARTFTGVVVERRKRTTKSSILDHLLESSHQIQPDTAFRVIYRVPPHLNKGVKKRLLSTAEAVAIRLFDPTLCRQKSLTRALLLPWPDCRRDREHTPGVRHDMSHT